MLRQQRFAEWFLMGGIAASLLGTVLRFSPGAESQRVFGPSDLLMAAALAGTIGAALLLRRRARQTPTAEVGLRRLVNAACDAVIVVGADRCIADISPRGAALFGYPPSESLVGWPLGDLLPDWSPLPADWPTAVRGQVAADGTAEFQGLTRARETLALEITVGAAVGWPREAMALLIRDVTRTKRVREELRAKEAHLRLVVGQMPAILWTTDAGLQITSTIGAGLAALDLKPAEVIRMSMLETLGREDPECTPVSAHWRALHGESLTHEMEWKGRSFQVRVDPLRNPERKITGTIGVVLDVTDHKQTVAELKARVCQQAAIADLGQQALAGGDIDRLIEDAARAVRTTLQVELCEMLELTPGGETLRARAGSEWGGSERGPALAGMDSPAGHAVRTGAPISAADLRIDPRFADDTLVSAHGVVSSLSVLVHGRDRPFGVLSAHATRHRPFTQDDRNFLQSAAHVLAAALDRKNADATQTRLVALLEATTDAVAIAGADHRLLYVNRAGRAMLGLGEHEILTQQALGDFYPGELRARFLNEVVPTALRKGAWSGELDLQGRTGQVWTVSQLVLAHRSPEGDVEFLSTVSRDLGERLHLEGQLRQAQKMEAVGRLAGGIAHDFNNLLCIITGYTEMALSQLSGGTPLHNFLIEINKAGNRAATLTRQLLAFSRKSLLTPKVLDLDVLIRDAGTMLRRLIGEDIELAMIFEPNLPAVKADPNQLEQVLMNLAVNARDAMPQGGRLEVRTARVRLDAEQVRDQPEVQPGCYVLLAVSDTGCGMDTATRARIFEPFFTTKGVGKGTGLGLAMVYGIVKQSGGHVEVETAPGRGTTFRVYLPFAGENSADTAPPPLSVALPQGTETVLLAEDEDGVRALVLQVLRRSGYTVLEARDGLEALTLSESHSGPIHLLLTDVVMPRLGGGRLARRVNRQRPDTRVLFMSGFADSTLVRHEVLSGDVDCLLKPFTPEVLARKVRETLDNAVAGAAV
jgi:PAS domain S-box-containing protein